MSVMVSCQRRIFVYFEDALALTLDVFNRLLLSPARKAKGKNVVIKD